MSFDYDFNKKDKDETYFAYNYPYSFTRLNRVLKEIKNGSGGEEEFIKD